jgi:predicted O-methyltransferase YrrM
MEIHQKIELLEEIRDIVGGNISERNFEDFDALPLMSIINLLGLECGIELGTFIGISTLGLLHYCPTVKKLYTIDKYEPFVDTMPPFTEVTSEESALLKKCSEKILKSSYDYVKDRVEIVYGDTLEVAKDFEDEKYDFIFMDSHLTAEQLKCELPLWYPKIKKGGIISIHDTEEKEVRDVVMEFVKENNITSHIGYFNNTSLWVK